MLSIHAANSKSVSITPSIGMGISQLSIYKQNSVYVFRAIAFLVLRIVATHPTYVFKSFDYQPPGGKAEPVDLIQSVSSEKAAFLEGAKREAVDGLLSVVAAYDNFLITILVLSL